MQQLVTEEIEEVCGAGMAYDLGVWCVKHLNNWNSNPGVLDPASRPGRE